MEEVKINYYKMYVQAMKDLKRDAKSYSKRNRYDLENEIKQMNKIKKSVITKKQILSNKKYYLNEAVKLINAYVIKSGRAKLEKDGSFSYSHPYDVGTVGEVRMICKLNKGLLTIWAAVDKKLATCNNNEYDKWIKMDKKSKLAFELAEVVL